MKGQVDFYNSFGRLYGQSILTCPEPELWTTDYDIKGRVYLEMKERIGFQQKFIEKYFTKDHPVLDIGCGFGRQASWLGKKGFRVVGIDSSPVFTDLARQIFQGQGYTGDFITGTLENYFPHSKFTQVLMLDVLEHFPVSSRKHRAKRIAELMVAGGILFISLPHVKGRMSSRINNSIVRRIKSRFGYFRRREEHPYPIPTHEQVNELFSPAFICREFLTSAPTDYYIFQKR